MQLINLLIYIVETHHYIFKPYVHIVLPQVLAEELHEAFGDSADHGRATDAAEAGCIMHIATAASRSLDHADTDSYPAGQGTPPCWKCPDDELSDESSELAFVM